MRLSRFFSAIFIVAIIIGGSGMAIPSQEGSTLDWQNLESPFGVSSVDKLSFPDFSSIGVKWVRSDFVWWGIEKDRGKPSWAGMDGHVGAAEKAGILHHGILGFTPKWSSPYPEERVSEVYPPENLEHWTDFVARTVSRYKDRIRYWEIWNEPNIPFLKATSKEYIDLVKSASLVIRSIDPQAKIIVGSTSLIDVPFIERLYQLGMKDYIDIISIHQYEANRDFRAEDGAGFEQPYSEELEELREVIEKYGDHGRPIWGNEWSLYGSGYGDPSWDEQLREARNIVKMYVFSISQGVDKVFYFNARSILGRFASIAFNTMSSLLEDALYIGDLNLGDKIHAPLFLRDGQPIMVVWCSRGSQRLGFDAGSEGLELIDLQGKTVELKTADGFVEFEISETPLFLEGLSREIAVKVAGDLIRGFLEKSIDVLNDEKMARESGLSSLHILCEKMASEPVVYEVLLRGTHRVRLYFLRHGDFSRRPLKERMDLLYSLERAGDLSAIILGDLVWRGSTDQPEAENALKAAEAEIAVAERKIRESGGINPGLILPQANRLHSKSTRFLSKSGYAIRQGYLGRAKAFAIWSGLLAEETGIACLSGSPEELRVWTTIKREVSIVEEDERAKRIGPLRVGSGESMPLKVEVVNNLESDGELEVQVPDGWQISPDPAKFRLISGNPNRKQSFKITVTAPEKVKVFTSKEELGDIEYRRLGNRLWEESTPYAHPLVAGVKIGETQIETVQQLVAVHELFLDDWSLIGPFEDPESGGLLKTYPPESRVDLEGSHKGKDGPVVWKPYTTLKEEYHEGELLIKKWLSGDAEDWSKVELEPSIVYGVNYIYSPEDQAGWLGIGRSCPMKVWVGDKEVFKSKYSQIVFRSKADEELAPIELKKGWNQILIKVLIEERDRRGIVLLRVMSPLKVETSRIPEKI